MYLRMPLEQRAEYPSQRRPLDGDSFSTGSEEDACLDRQEGLSPEEKHCAKTVKVQIPPND